MWTKILHKYWKNNCSQKQQINNLQQYVAKGQRALDLRKQPISMKNKNPTKKQKINININKTN